MASGKQRTHKPRGKGRPRKDRDYTHTLELEIARLRALNFHRVNNSELWKALLEVVATANHLETQTTTLASKALNSSGHSAEQPTFSGTYMAPAEDEEGYDPDKHRGDRDIYHTGKHAAALLNHLIRNLSWVAEKAREELVKRPTPMRPRGPSLTDPEDCVACAKIE